MKIKEFRFKLYPKNFSVSKKFYEETLDLEIFHEWDRHNDQGAMFRAGNATIELLSPPDTDYEAYTGTGLSLEVEDVRQLFDELKNKCTITHELRHNPWGDTSFGIEDPEGYKISFFEKDE